jgi:hypothetical protein
MGFARISIDGPESEGQDNQSDERYCKRTIIYPIAWMIAGCLCVLVGVCYLKFSLTLWWPQGFSQFMIIVGAWVALLPPFYFCFLGLNLSSAFTTWPLLILAYAVLPPLT